MQITDLYIANYKSLREVSFNPGRLSVVLGANASGKSNLADFHDFLAELYRHGLSVAVARKGGYENIAHRKMRRSRGAIYVDLTAEFSIRTSNRRDWEYRLNHSFSFKAVTQSIKSDFRIESEKIRMEGRLKRKWILLAEITRTGDQIEINLNESAISRNSNFPKSWARFSFLSELNEYFKSEPISKTELAINYVSGFVPQLRHITRKLGSIRVFQLSPTNTRGFGVPIPQPEIDIHGGNLPAVVDMMIEDYPENWDNIMETMQRILPNLRSIEVDYTHLKTLGLYFYEEGVGRPWNVAEVSDGTIHSLALLVALYDPRNSLLFLEEPENSVHTWILRALMEAAKESSSDRQIIFTTHSTVVIDAAEVNDVWVIWREEGESRMARITDLDENIADLVSSEDLSLSEILDTGAIKESIPPGPVKL